MRRVIFNRIVKRAAYGFAFILLSYIVKNLGIQKALLGAKFGITWVDFIYVLAISFIPDMILWTGYGILFSIVILLLKYNVLPVHRIEKQYLGIKKGQLRKSIFLVGLIVLFLFILPWLMREPTVTGEIVSGIDESSMGISAGFAGIGGYLGLILGNAVLVFSGIFNFFLIKPLYIFSPLRVDAVLAGMLFSSLLYHSIMVSMNTRNIKVTRNVSKHLCQQGDTVSLKTTMKSSFPLPGLYLSRTPVSFRSRSATKLKTEKNILGNSVESTEEIAMNEGYYNLDIVPISIFTLPFFHTKVYKVCAENSDVSVVPSLKRKTMVHIRKPTFVKETGSLIKKQLGSSMDFAGMKEYTHDDPLGRIWWKGLAKHGNLLVKQYHSFAEDRWMLVLDFSNQNLGESDSKAMLSFSRLFIELCTRKDIAVGLSTFSPSFHYIDYETNKKDLLSGLTKVTMPLYEISQKGTECILEDAVAGDIDKLKNKCRKKHMTLSMVYSYCGLGKRKSYFSWKGENVFKDSMEKFFTNLKRSGKIVIVTDGNTKNLEMFKKFKSICQNRRCRYIFVLVGPKNEILSQLRKAEVKHIVVSNEKLMKPNFILSLVSLV